MEARWSSDSAGSTSYVDHQIRWIHYDESDESDWQDKIRWKAENEVENSIDKPYDWLRAVADAIHDVIHDAIQCYQLAPEGAISFGRVINLNEFIDFAFSDYNANFIRRNRASYATIL